MATKKSRYAPRKIMLPSIQRSEKNLAKIKDTKNFTVAYCWFDKHSKDPIPGIAQDTLYFIFDICKGKNKTVSVYLDMEQMHDVVEECRLISSLSICELAQRMVLDGIKETDPRYIYWSLALREFDIDSISYTVRQSELSTYIPWLTDQIISHSGIGFDAEKDEWTKTILAQFIEAVYHAEIAIKSGERYMPVAYIDYDPKQTIPEPGTDVQRWPNHKLRVGYKPFVDGVRNFNSWQLMAQIDYFRYVEEPIIDDNGNLICTEPISLENVSDPEITVTVTNEDFARLLDQIGYRLANTESL